jgi:hypothetical protein
VEDRIIAIEIQKASELVDDPRSLKHEILE